MLSLTWYPGKNKSLNSFPGIPFAIFVTHGITGIFQISPWNFQVIFYMVPWKLGIAQYLPWKSMYHLSDPLEFPLQVTFYMVPWK